MSPIDNIKCRCGATPRLWNDDHPEVTVHFDPLWEIDREMEEESAEQAIKSQRDLREALDGRCGGCGRHVDVELVEVEMHGDVSSMPVGGKTFRKTKMKVPVCVECRAKMRKAASRCMLICVAVFAIMVITGIVLALICEGSAVPFIGGGVLFGLLAAGGIHSCMADSGGEQVLSGYRPIAELLKQGWSFGSSPGKG